MKQVLKKVIHALFFALIWVMVKIATFFTFLFKQTVKLFSWIKINVAKLLRIIFALMKKAFTWIINLPKLTKKLYYTSLHWLKWKKKIWHLRYYPTILSVENVIKSILLNGICMLSFGFIIQQAKLFSVENNVVLFSNKVGPINIENSLSILGTQISVTRIVRKNILWANAQPILRFPQKVVFPLKPF